MAVRLLEVAIGKNQTITIETEDVRARGGAVSAVTRLKSSFSEVVDQMASLVSPIYDTLSRHSPGAEQITVEFGFKVSADTGIVVAKTQAEGNFKVSMSWKKPTSSGK